MVVSGESDPFPFEVPYDGDAELKADTSIVSGDTSLGGTLASARRATSLSIDAHVDFDSIGRLQVPAAPEIVDVTLESVTLKDTRIEGDEL